MAILFQMIILLAAQLYSAEPYQYGKQVLELQNRLAPLFPREENSENEKLLFAFLEEQFSLNGVEYHINDYNDSERGHSFSLTYSARIEGEIEDTLIIAVPLNNKEDQNSIRSGSVNIASALQLLRIFSRYKPPVSIEFLFLGAERGAGAIYPVGSNQFLENFTATRPTVVLYLDLSAPGEQIVLRNSSDNDLSPLWLVKSLGNLLSEENLSFAIDSVESLAYQSGFENASPLINTYLENEVPMLLLESRSSIVSPYPDDRWINGFLESLLALILKYEKGFPEEWDRHYLIAEREGRLIILSEKTGVVVFTAIVSVLLLVLLFKSRNLHLNLKRFRNHLWTFPLLFFLTFLCLFLSTLIIEDISGIRDYPQFWIRSPLLFLFFKICLSMLLYTGFLHVIRGFSVSPSHHFYTYSAFASVIISLVTVMIFNISFSYFFLWSLMGTAAFMISRRKFLKRIAIVLTPLPLVLICFRFFSEPYSQICRFLLLSRISGNLFFTIIIMPTIMLLASLNHFLHRFHRHRKSYRNFLSLAAWGGLALFSLYSLITLDSFSPGNRQPVYIDEVIDLDENSRSISIESPAPVGNVKLQLDELTLNLTDVGRSAQITAPMMPRMLDVAIDSSSFLDRRRLNYRIDAVGSPDRIAVELRSGKPLIIFDSNFPSERSADGKSVMFHIGANPGLPLDLNIILSRSASPDMNLKLEYTTFPYRFGISNPLLDLRKKLTVTSSIIWEN